MITRGNAHGSSHGGGASSLGYLFGESSTIPADANAAHTDGDVNASANTNANPHAKEEEKRNQASVLPAGLPSDRLWRPDVGAPPPMTAIQLRERMMMSATPSDFARGSPSGHYGNSSRSVAELMRSAGSKEGATPPSSRSQEGRQQGQECVLPVGDGKSPLSVHAQATGTRQTPSSSPWTASSTPTMQVDEGDWHFSGKRDSSEVRDGQEQKQEGEKKENEAEEGQTREEVVKLSSPSFARRARALRVRDGTTSVAQIMSDGVADPGGRVYFPPIQSPHRSPSKSRQSSRGPSSPASAREVASLPHGGGEHVVRGVSPVVVNRSWASRFRDSSPSPSPSSDSLKRDMDSSNPNNGGGRSPAPAQLLRGRTPVGIDSPQYSLAGEAGGGAAALLVPVRGARSAEDEEPGGLEVPVLRTPKFGRRSSSREAATRCVADCLTMDNRAVKSAAAAGAAAADSSPPSSTVASASERQLQERLRTLPRCATTSQWGKRGDETLGSARGLRAGYQRDASVSSSKTPSSGPMLGRQSGDVPVPSPRRLEPLDVSSSSGSPLARLAPGVAGANQGPLLTPPTFALKSFISTAADRTGTVADCLREAVSTTVSSQPSPAGDSIPEASSLGSTWQPWKRAGCAFPLAGGSEREGSGTTAISRLSIGDVDSTRQVVLRTSSDLRSEPLFSSSLSSFERATLQQQLLSDSAVSLRHDNDDAKDDHGAPVSPSAIAAVPDCLENGTSTGRELSAASAQMTSSPPPGMISDGVVADHGGGLISEEEEEDCYSPLPLLPLVASSSATRAHSVSRKVLLESLIPKPARVDDDESTALAPPPNLRWRSFHGIALKGGADRELAALRVSKDDIASSGNGTATTPVGPVGPWARRAEPVDAASGGSDRGQTTFSGLDPLTIESEGRAAVAVNGLGGEAQSLRNVFGPTGRWNAFVVERGVGDQEGGVGERRGEKGGTGRGARRGSSLSLPTSPGKTNDVIILPPFGEAATRLMGNGAGTSSSNDTVRSAWEDNRSEIPQTAPPHLRRLSLPVASAAGRSVAEPTTAGGQLREEWQRPRSPVTNVLGDLGGERKEAEDHSSAVSVVQPASNAAAPDHQPGRRARQPSRGASSLGYLFGGR